MEKIYNSDNYSIEVLYHIGAYENSIHFIFDESTKTCAIVDPAWELKYLLHLLLITFGYQVHQTF